MNVTARKWLAQALEVLSVEGVQGVRIERLARDLNIPKSSFYGHFTNRQDLLEKMLDYWANEFTKILTQSKALQEASPESRLERLMQMVQDHKLAKYDIAIRAWAEYDPLAAKVVADVYQRRLDYIGQTFKELGFRGDELEMRTRLFVCYHTWEAAMFGKNTESNSDRLVKLRHNLLTRK
jgi:AcrR family transcriptional regulator